MSLPAAQCGTGITSARPCGHAAIARQIRTAQGEACRQVVGHGVTKLIEEQPVSEVISWPERPRRNPIPAKVARLKESVAKYGLEHRLLA